MMLKKKKLKVLKRKSEKQKLLRIAKKNQSLRSCFEHSDLTDPNQKKTFLMQALALMNFIEVECRELSPNAKVSQMLVDK